MSQREPIPFYGYCEHCKKPIQGENLLLNGLDPVCWGCWRSTGEVGTDHTRRNPENVGADQIADAKQAMDRPLDDYVHLPFGSLNALVGAIPPGDVGFVVAFSGLGKTTWVTSAVQRWIDAGKRVYCVPLESKPKTFRTHLACKSLGLHAGMVLTGEYERSTPGQWPTIRQRIITEMDKQVAGEMATRLYVSPTKRMDTLTLTKAAEHAAKLECDIFIIDHIDHITAGDGKSLHAESVKVVDHVLDLTQRLELATICTSQSNHEGLKGDRLGKYQCPEPHHVYMGGKKRQIASWMTGLFRPLRFTSLDPADLASARAGRLEPWKVLEPNCMGVGLMKSRHFGERDGQRAYLTVTNGVVKDMDAADMAAIQHGIDSTQRSYR